MSGQGLVIGRLVACLREYAAAHLREYGVPISEDGVLGDYWQAIASAILGLLNGETAPLDPGEVDHAVRQLARDCGFSDEEAANL